MTALPTAGFSTYAQGSPRAARLALCRRLLRVALLAQAMAETPPLTIEPAQPRCCPNCGGQRLVYAELEPALLGSARLAPVPDSS